MRIVHGARLITAAFGDRFWSQITKSFALHNKSLSVYDLASRFSKSRLKPFENIAPTDQDLQARKAVCALTYYFLILCGLWFGQDLLEHRSGIVLVPSIINDPHSLQMLPVGFALIVKLHFG